MIRAVLITKGGAHLIIKEHDILIGRHPSCHIVLTDPHASNYQALIHIGIGGLELLVLGRASTMLNDQVIGRKAALADGDRIDLPGETLTLHIPESAVVSVRWVAHFKDTIIGLHGSHFTIGGSPKDMLLAEGLPPAAIAVWTSEENLLLELNHPCRLNQTPHPAGSVVALYLDTLLACEQHTLHLIPERTDQTMPTLTAGLLHLPTSLSFTFLPKGGELRLQIAGQPIVVQLSELRARLVAALLQPTHGFVVGDFVPDEQLLNRIWPRQSNKTRIDLNTLIHRTRKHLDKHGLNGAELLQRTRSGLATRLFIAPDARIEIL